MPSYYLAATLIQGDDLAVVWAPASLLWMVFGVLAGVVFGIGGTWARKTGKTLAEACTAAGVRQSMSTVGSSADNAAAESFNATFKRETLQGRRAFTNEREARLTAFRWLHRPNSIRRHSRLGQQPPITYEKNTQPEPATLPRPHKPRVQDQGSSPGVAMYPATLGTFGGTLAGLGAEGPRHCGESVRHARPHPP